MKIDRDIILNSKKIAIFGWPATGKSTFGEELCKLTKIPLYSLDLIRWKNSNNGQKNDEKFLIEYNKILANNKWIMEGNALDWISSRLEQSDILFFFESTIEECINNFKCRDIKITNDLEKRKGFLEEKKVPVEESIDWIKNRYSKKIDKLRVTLKEYDDKLIIINNYNELNSLLDLLK